MVYYWFEKIKLIMSCEQLEVCHVIESVNGVIIIIMNIMCFDAFVDLIEYMLEPLSRCSFICDIKWNWKSIVWWWRWTVMLMMSSSCVNNQYKYLKSWYYLCFWWVLVMDDCNCKSSIINPSVVMNATMEQVNQHFFVRLRFQPFFKSPISILPVLD